MLRGAFRIANAILAVLGKGENIWDRFTHETGNIANNDTGDVACNSYYQYDEDIELLVDLGVRLCTDGVDLANICHPLHKCNERNVGQILCVFRIKYRHTCTIMYMCITSIRWTIIASR